MTIYSIFINSFDFLLTYVSLLLLMAPLSPERTCNIKLTIDNILTKFHIGKAQSRATPVNASLSSCTLPPSSHPESVAPATAALVAPENPTPAASPAFDRVTDSDQNVSQNNATSNIHDQTFTHETLNRDIDEIRLIALQPCIDATAVIKCKIVTVRLSDHP